MSTRYTNSRDPQSQMVRGVFTTKGGSQYEANELVGPANHGAVKAIASSLRGNERHAFKRWWKANDRLAR